MRSHDFPGTWQVYRQHMNNTGQGEDMSVQKQRVAGGLLGSMLLLTVCLPAHAGWAFPELTAKSSPAGLDQAFECEVQQRMDAQADHLQGVDAVVTRFGNTIVITGQARDAGDRERLDQLVLKVAGITREQTDTPVVVPARIRGCEGKSLAGNSKRKSIVKTSRECSSLRVADDLQVATKGQVFNHIAIASADPLRQLALAGMLAAQARLSLLDAGVINAMDRRLVRLVAQDNVVYVLGHLDAARQSEIRTVLMTVAGIDVVQFYID